ncbi:MAG: glycosyltransferase family 2 protein [Candidatus Omnitrophica bacterium]|nr:glycosyltransferase family 2 protein [Candidatus Omnitrophota bacterium]
MEFIFWFFLTAIIYCYFGYPALLWLTAKILKRPVKKAACEPFVSIVVSVWNEADVIERKLRNLTALDYPQDKIEILIGSDGSTDKTNKLIQIFIGNPQLFLDFSPTPQKTQDTRHKTQVTSQKSQDTSQEPRPVIHFFPFPQRRGKMAVLNDLVGQAKGEIIFFTDARQNIASDALRQLTANFSDPSVGCVSGELMLSKKEGGTAKGINLYWNYEKFIRRLESDIHSMLGATGAIYAIRRDLFTPIPDGVVLDDMFVPLNIVQKRCRAIFDPEALAYDDVAVSAAEESRRKTRTLFGNFQIFKLFARLFNPLSSPVAIQFFSHKFLRITAPFFLIFIFLINILLINDIFFVMMFVLQISFYAMAGAGAFLRSPQTKTEQIISKICYGPYVFCLLNFSALLGFLRFFSNEQDVKWEKARQA